jgi:hypothetical protein
MKWQIGLLGIVVGCGLGGLMALTNPNRAAYESFAVDRIGELAKDKCDHAPDGLGVFIQGPCRAAIEAYKPELRPVLAATTSRQNWVLFSIYRSNIMVPIVNLQVRVESIGIFDRFFVYKTP